MKKTTALFALPLAALLIAGCSAGPEDTDNSNGNNSVGGDNSLIGLSCEEFQSQVLDSEMKICGTEGELAGLEFSSIEKSTEVRTETITKGSGGKLEPGKIYYISYSAYNAQTGEPLFNKATNEGYTPVIFVDLGSEQYPDWMNDAFSSHEIGGRFIAAVPIDEDGSDLPGLASDENILWVFDIKQEIKLLADGETQPTTGKLPSVTLDSGGRPTVSIPDSKPSSEFQLEVLKKGTGDVVPEDAEVWVQYQGINWRTGEVFDESWNRGQPSNFKLNQVVQGFAQAIAGQTVGSQVIVSFPPELGYGSNGNANAGIEGTDTLVFTVDILASVSGS